MQRQWVTRWFSRILLWRWDTLAVLGLLALGIAAGWEPVQAGDASEGKPRLVVDRTEVDLGDLPYGAPAQAVFTLTNTGDSVLKIAGEPQVKILKGC
jgi:hypothetical protein